MRFGLLAIALIACEPTYDGTAFKCDTSHGCPLDQTCIDSRCRRVPALAIDCGATICGPTQQCCADVLEGSRCIGAGDVCPDDSALCDGKDDCAEKERCCNAEVTACALACDSEAVACASDSDCPTDAIHCCRQVLLPWGRCSRIDC